MNELNGSLTLIENKNCIVITKPIQVKLDKHESYVYIYLDPRKPGIYEYIVNDKLYTFNCEPFYVGKGTYYRLFDHLTESEYFSESIKIKGQNTFKCRKIRKIQKEINSNPIILKIKEKLSHKNAKDLEKLLIKTIGRRDTGLGPLTNMTDGGDGGLGCVRSEEFKKNKSIWWKEYFKDPQKLKEKSDRLLGHIISEETKDKISKSLMGRKQTKERIEKTRINSKDRIPIYNKDTDDMKRIKKDQPIPDGYVVGCKPVTKELRKKHSKRNLKLWQNDEYKNKMKKMRIGNGNSNAKYIYTITKDSGEIIISECLKEYCKDNNLSYGTLFAYIKNNKKYKNLTITKELRNK